MGAFQAGFAAQADAGSPPFSLSPSTPRAGPSLGVLALFIKHHNLVHAEDGTGSGDLASQVGAELGRLRVVKNGARQGHAQSVGPSWARRGGGGVFTVSLSGQAHALPSFLCPQGPGLQNLPMRRHFEFTQIDPTPLSGPQSPQEENGLCSVRLPGTGWATGQGQGVVRGTGLRLHPASTLYCLSSPAVQMGMMMTATIYC